MRVPRPWQCEPEPFSALLPLLGYQRMAAEQAVKRAIGRAGESGSFEQLFRQTMGLLQK